MRFIQQLKQAGGIEQTLDTAAFTAIEVARVNLLVHLISRYRLGGQHQKSRGYRIRQGVSNL